jgi:tRNA (guanosine-2'-O-)-methyltransferase
MNQSNSQQLMAYLLSCVTHNKRDKIAATLSNRTRHITIALEDLYQEHNAAAALRSAECFGIQDIHIVESNHKFKPAVSIAMGSPKWLDIHRYRSVEQCIETLKKDNYKIIATTPHTSACTIYDLPLESKVALFFGTEDNGLSPYVMEQADGYAVIPMYGFTESFNVSVSVALCLQALVTRMQQSGYAWQLTDQEQDDLMLQWLRKIIRGAAAHEKRFLQSQL